MIGRRLLLAAPLAGCTAGLVPLDGASDFDAQALLAKSAAAHGSLAGLAEIRVAYAGRFDSLVGRLQPELVDAGHRSLAQDTVTLPYGRHTQMQSGPAGAKRVQRDPGTAPSTVRVWFDGIEAIDRPRRDAAAVVADCYRLFLLGPLMLTGAGAEQRRLTMVLAEPESIIVDGQAHPCDVIRMTVRPGLGLSERDELLLFIDRAQQLMRRVRFTLNGHVPTRGAIAETDCWGHVAQGGVRWATQYEERLLRPAPLPVHEWRMTGLGVVRG